MAGAAAIIVAAGSSERFGGDEPKQFISLAGRPVLMWSVDRFAASQAISSIVVVTAAGHIERVRSLTASVDKIADVVAGGATRQESVRLGLAAIGDQCENVLVHDAARPCISNSLLSSIIEALVSHEAVVPAVPVPDTLVLSRAGTVDAIIDRVGVHGVQTPQAFRTDLLRRAHRRAEARGFETSDDGSLVLAMDEPVHVVQGETTNIKITLPSDLAIAEAILGSFREKG